MARVGPRIHRPASIGLSPEAAWRRLVLSSCGTHANAIRILVPLTVSDAVLDEGLSTIGERLVAALSG